MLPLTVAQLPNALIRFPPLPAHDLAESAQHPALDRLERPAALDIGVCSEHDFAVDVELPLRPGVVADSYRP